MQILDPRLTEHNLQWLSTEEFIKNDKHLSDLRAQKYIYNYSLGEEIKNNGVFLIFGGRQIGKTTSLKQLLANELSSKKLKNKQSLYINCDVFNDRRELEEALRSFFNEIDRKEHSLIIIDEVCVLKDWQLTIKAIIDLGWTSNSRMILTGSDRILLEDGAKGFPGVNRRGIHGKDIHLYPLKFKEFIKLVKPEILIDPQKEYSLLEASFQEYLLLGGYLSAINLYHKNRDRFEAALITYQQWIYSDFNRKNRDKAKLIEILRVLVERYGSQLSFNKIANESQGLSTETVINYIEHLERLDILIVLQAYNHSKKTAFPKKERRFHFADPFMAQTAMYILKKEKIIPNDYTLKENYLVESAVVSNYRSKNKLYYIKGEGEVDLVIPQDKGFLPIEVKWSSKLKEQELKQILKYPNGIILNKNLETGKIKSIQTKNLILNLLEI
jgi:uncharacterized protein